MRGVMGRAPGGVSIAALWVMTGAVSPTWAADKLTIASPAAWVAPIATPADDGKSSDVPLKLLLRDEQIDLQPGTVTRYFESVFKVQTPQGLSAGAVSFAWNPDTQAPIVHKLQIRRGAQVIDVLGSGQTFTVMRRETNLENAVLDGQLTASIQPEGLQVGDIVDFSLSIVTSDPAMGKHVEHAGAAWNGVPIGRAHIRAQWPSSVTMHIQPDGGLSAPKVVRKGGLSSIEMSADNLEPLVLPKGAPMRYRYGRLLELTDMASWNAVVTLLAPLYAKAEVLPARSAVQIEIDTIKAASSDPKARAEAALALVQDRVRYVFLGMNDGGLVPADAETTWSRRFGDCKGKTVLLLAMLHELGIDAVPVLVSTTLGDGLDKRLPEIGLFDHVLVRATIGGRVYWLDGTRVGDRALDGIETPDLKWGLPLTPGNAALVAMAPAPYDRPQTDVAIRIDATTGLSTPAPVHIERMVRGDEAVGTNLALANLAGDMRDRALREFWKQRYDFVDPKTVSTRYDPVARALTLVMDGTTKMDWSEGWYEADHVWVGYTADFSRDPGPDSDAPYTTGYPSYTHVTETILLPPMAGAFTITPGSDVDQTVAGIEYHRHSKIDAGRFIVEESDRAVAPEFPATQATAAQDALRKLAKRGVFLNRPANYVDTAALADVATTANGLIDQGNTMLDLGRYPEAVDRLTKAIALDPKNAIALADRGVARAGLDQRDAAKADLDAAAAIDPRNYVVFQGRGLLAERTKQPQEAIDQFSAALAVQPDSKFALWHRAIAYHALGKDDQALADTTILLASAPGDPDLRLMRANIFMGRGDSASTAREADALIAANPANGFALVVAGKIYDAVGRRDDAMIAIGKALAIKPEAYLYINRYHVRPRSDVEGRQADLDAALKLDPKMEEAIATKADFLSEQGRWREAADLLSGLIATKPDDIDLLSRRGVAYAKLGANALADKDFTTARASATTGPALNNICWAKATAGVALDRALDECTAALALLPDATNIHDSHAFVLLRLGRFDEAVAEYSQILAKAPGAVSSLYGRALAEQRKGDDAAASRDAEAAMKLSPHIRERYDGYGMTLKPSAIATKNPRLD
ncbi:DUF3857 domain-containing protein [Sphingomonas oryzagri]